MEAGEQGRKWSVGGGSSDIDATQFILQTERLENTKKSSKKKKALRETNIELGPLAYTAEVSEATRSVSGVARDLSGVILAQRGRLVNLKSKAEIKEAQVKLDALESLLREAIIAQTAEVKKRGADKDKKFEAEGKLLELKSRLREAIIKQGGRVRKLEGNSENEEAVRRLESLVADYKAATGKDWSDVRDEGPILLTFNEVRGNDLRQELRQRLLELREQNIIR